MNLRYVFDNAMTYEAYTSILGQNLSLHQLHYRKCIIDPDWILKIKSFRPANILMITEPWCSDSLALLPIVRRISEINGQWHIVFSGTQNPIIGTDVILTTESSMNH